MKKIFLIISLFLISSLSYSQIYYFTDLGYTFYATPNSSKTLIYSHAVTVTPRFNYSLNKTSSISLSSELSIGTQFNSVGPTTSYLTWNIPVVLSYNKGQGARLGLLMLNLMRNSLSDVGWFFGAGVGTNRMKTEILLDETTGARTYAENIVYGAYLSTGIRFLRDGAGLGLRFNCIYPLINKNVDNDLHYSEIVYGLTLFYTVGDFRRYIKKIIVKRYKNRNK